MLSLREKQFQKPALTKSHLLDVIRHRWSPRAFDSRPVEREKLLSLFEAARWAASGGNSQPWRFIVASRDDEETFQKLLSLLNERNHEWMQTAPVLFLAISQTERPDGSPMSHGDHDTGMATAHITLQATERGLASHIVGGFNSEKAREVFAIPENFKPLTMMAIGYYGDFSQLSEFNQGREQGERTRKPLEEFIFSGKFGESSGLVK